MKLGSLEAVVAALNHADVRFIVVEGLAVVAHGYGRQTADLDPVIRLDSGTIHSAFGALKALGYLPRIPVTADGFADPEQRARWIAEKKMTILAFHSEQHRETPVDLFVTERFPFDDEYTQACIEEIAPGISTRILRLPALLPMKRTAGRPQDLADVAELQMLHGEPKDG